MRPPQNFDKSTRRELNQFSKYSSNVSSAREKAPHKSVWGGASFGFVAISVIYSLSLLGVTRVLRSAEVVSWSLSFPQALAVSALFVLVRTIERAISSVGASSSGGSVER